MINGNSVYSHQPIHNMAKIEHGPTEQNVITFNDKSHVCVIVGTTSHVDLMYIHIFYDLYTR